MKLFIQSMLMFNSFVTLPAATVFLIYATGVALLQWKAEFFVWGLVAFVFFALAQCVIATFSE